MIGSDDAATDVRVAEPRSQFLPALEGKKPPAGYFEWTSANEIGHAEIDAQHRRLFLLGKAVVEPLRKSPGSKRGAARLEMLTDFAEEHFAFEQGLMRSAAYPGADQHAKFHASLLTELRTYCYKARRRLHTNPVGLLSFVSDWITLEIDSADREFVVWSDSGH